VVDLEKQLHAALRKMPAKFRLNIKIKINKIIKEAGSKQLLRSFDTQKQLQIS